MDDHPVRHLLCTFVAQCHIVAQDVPLAGGHHHTLEVSNLTIKRKAVVDLLSATLARSVGCVSSRFVSVGVYPLVVAGATEQCRPQLSLQASW
eukprot:1317436-Amphidinium_carterae.1